MTFVDEIGFDRKCRKLRAANVDVVLRFLLQLPNDLHVEVPLDTRVACRRDLGDVVLREDGELLVVRAGGREPENRLRASVVTQ